MANLIGQSLGRYQILEQLGEGGMATVYKAYDTRLERDVAVKVIRTDLFGQAILERILKRFEREAKVLAKLSHPNIVHINDYGEQDGVPYLVMDYLPGGTLKQRLGRPMSYQEAVRLLVPIARALDYAHRQGMIHRDVKPSNILITSDGEPLLTDFGIAKLLESEESQTLTGTGVGVGTPEYMAPEQWTGQANPQSDLYSLGVVLFELVTGRKPYLADTPAAILLKQATEPLPRPSQFVRDLPEAVEKVLFKAMAKKPEDRYQSMGEMATALEQLGSRQTVPALKSVPPVEPKLARLEDVETTRDSASLTLTGPSKPVAVETRRPTVARRRWLSIAGTLLVLMIVIFILFNRYGTQLETLFATRAPSMTPTSRYGIGSTWTRPQDGMVMVYVPAGSFSRGSDIAYSDEQPAHTVLLDAYWIDRTEVTNGMYAKCVAAGACQSPSESSSNTRSSYYGNSLYDGYPVVYVNWNAAQKYCQWAGARLPTEAEWEKAARSTDGRIYPWGSSSPSCALDNYYGCVDDTSAVGSYPGGASPYGALDMAGNVAEWVNDWFSATYYSQSPQSNPQGPASGSNRVFRGGSWFGLAYGTRASNRTWNFPETSLNYLGFRCSRSTFP